MEISVTIPTIGTSPYLKETLCKLNEALSHDIVKEIIVVDNASEKKDEIKELTLRYFPNTGKYVRHKKRLSMAENWNSCLNAATCRYVHILHDDDYVLAGFYEEIQRLNKKAPDASFYATRAYLINESSEVTGCSSILPESLSPENVELAFNSRVGRIYCPTIVTDKNKLISVGGFSSEYNYCMDIDAWRKLINVSCAMTSKSLKICYRSHDQSATKTLRTSGKHLKDFLKYCERHEDNNSKYISSIFRNYVDELYLFKTKSMSKEESQDLNKALLLAPLRYRIEKQSLIHIETLIKFLCKTIFS